MPKRSTLKLTKRIVEKLKAEDKDAIYWDRELAGFGVRVHATGRKLSSSSPGTGRPEAGDAGAGWRGDDREVPERGGGRDRPHQAG